MEKSITEGGKGKGEANLFDGFTNPVSVFFGFAKDVWPMTLADSLPEFIVCHAFYLL
jgi:hypothetical protein